MKSTLEIMEKEPPEVYPFLARLKTVKDDAIKVVLVLGPGKTDTFYRGVCVYYLPGDMASHSNDAIGYYCETWIRDVFERLPTGSEVVLTQV